MPAASPFLLTDRPLFVDYNLYGVLGNYLFNSKTKLPKSEAPRTLAPGNEYEEVTFPTPFT